MISQQSVNKLLELYEQLRYWNRLLDSKELGVEQTKEAWEARFEILREIRKYSA